MISSSTDNITEITEQMMGGLADQATYVEGKVFVMYLYEEGNQGID
jgi:hypothetical protein